MRIRSVIILAVGILFAAAMFAYPFFLKLVTQGAQDQALQAGEAVEQKVTTNVEISQIFAYDASDGLLNGGEDRINILVRLGPGGESIKLEDLFVRIDSSDTPTAMTYSYNSTGVANEFQYSTQYLLQGDRYFEGDLSRSDLVQMEVVIPQGINIKEGSSMSVRIYETGGRVLPVDFILPQNFAAKRVTIYSY